MKSQPELLAGARQASESHKAILACNDYLRMGPGRSLQKLGRTYGESTVEKPPTKHTRTLETWSTGYGWQARAVSYDTAIEAEKNESLSTRRHEAMQTGLALDFERVVELKLLSYWLRRELLEIDTEGRVTGLNHSNIWLPDVKQVGSGEDAQRVDIERFNSAIIERYQSLLDDLARETGGRKQKASIETPDLKSLPEALRELARKVYGEAARHPSGHSQGSPQGDQD